MYFISNSSSEFDAILQKHIRTIPINAPTNKPIIKHNIEFLLFFNLTAAGRTYPAAVINRFFCWYLSSISPNTGTHQTAPHYASLESHHREDRPRLPPLLESVAGQKYHYPPCLSSLSLSLPLNV